MKKLFLVCFSFLSLHAFSQTHYTITGKVIDAETKLPLQGASVFAQNTTIGTATDAEGNFRLQLPIGGYELAITFVNYRSETKRVSNTDADLKDLLIDLKQKEKEMADVVIKSSNEVADGWEKYGDFFLENFIGKSINSHQCTIKNKAVVKFYFNKRRNRLKILADVPIEIENKALGYTIRIALDSFTHEYNTDISQYTGYPLFEEMQTSDSLQKIKWEMARAIAYKGSILHFMRSLYHKNLKQEGFEIQFLVNSSRGESVIRLKDFYGAMNYKMDDSTHLLDVHPNQLDVAVLFKNEKPEPDYLSSNSEANPKFELSILTFPAATSIGIEQNGYFFDQRDLTIANYWSWERIADMVPYDYSTPE
jgi:hypothetical protein